MQPKSSTWLNDIVEASDFILSVTAGSTLAAYERDRFLRSAVERNFEIIGEALLRLERTDQATAARIPSYRQIIGFRNRLVHGYDKVDHPQVWEIIRQSLPVLRSEVAGLLRAADGEG